MAGAPKDPRFQSVIDSLVADLGPDYFVLNDFWDGDLFAAGLSKPGDAYHLVYVAMDLEGGGLSFSRERSSRGDDGDRLEPQMPGSYSDVLNAVRAHLGPSS